ncbi:MAG: metalloregulator ArsR/SmtB family transcription factor [Fulvivirga sp.]|uniref:ArsR/SmtB family transcription factor n=1 Tax=Fulvivirga sp. TaxID=1931237 RepID=UPI0032EDA8C7
MKKPQNQHIDRILKAIADPTRREIFHALVVASVALPITQISQQYEISRQGVTKHIKTLEEAGLITINTKGRERYCQANPKQLKLIKDWLNYYDKFWDDALVRLGDHLDGES